MTVKVASIYQSQTFIFLEHAFKVLSKPGESYVSEHVLTKEIAIHRHLTNDTRALEPPSTNRFTIVDPASHWLIRYQ